MAEEDDIAQESSSSGQGRDPGEGPDGELEATLASALAEGERRLARPWPELLATGAVGGLDVATGVFALLLVKEATGNEMLASLAFGIGFIALTLGRSELFTENFLVPVVARVLRRPPQRFALLRLWGGTLLTNLVAGWVAMALVIVGYPRLRHVAIEVARHYPQQGIGSEAFAQAVIGGMAITLMTWMERGTESTPAKVVAAFSVAFLLAAGPLNHVIVVSLEMFAALVAGAPFSYAAAAGTAAFAALGNVVGGVGLVTVLRLLQIGRESLENQADTVGGERSA